MSSASRDAKGIGTNLLTLIAQAALPAFHVQLARLLHADGYGVYTWSNGFVEMFSLLTLFGMDQAVTRYVALATAEKDDRRAEAATGTALRVVLASGLVVSLLLVVTAPFVADVQHKPELVAPLRLLAVVPIFYHATTIFLVATQARQVMKYNFWVRGLLQPLGLFALTGVALRVAPNPEAAAIAVGAGMAITNVAAALFYGRELSLARTLGAVFSGPADWAVIKLALPLVATNLVWALQGRIDAFFLGHYRASAEMGAYAACVLYVQSISQLRGAFDPVVCAAIPPALARGAIDELNQTIQRQTRWLALAAMPLAVLFAGFGDGLLVVFGKDFVQGAPAMIALSVGHTVNALSLSAFAIPMSGHARYSTYAAITSLAIQAVLLPLLLPRWGLTGAAISSAAGIGLAQVLQAWFAWRLVKVHGLSRGLVKTVLAAGLAFAVGRLVYWRIDAVVTRFFVGVGIAAVVYVAALALFGLDAEEKAAIAGAITRLRARGRKPAEPEA
jgi:O-antigen/teichoic acid export membrane protein